METAECSESGACEGARCRRQLPAAPNCWTRRGAAGSGSAGFWRPWVDSRGEQEAAPHQAEKGMLNGPGTTEPSGKLSRYRHPVRLFWPKSKCYDYLYQEAEALLKNFPIQATISFYEDSDSEDEIEELICEN
ncbi:protein ripply2 [Pteronotus mesoamericanus]|uniref:protein ripply2 n=1 Tax=Pteronotus mesoamericanus TaxID=1884717 RepID=UPI0023EDC113|nr:protein ripply2 [Pteronotus parnellii mesoamericanus]